VRAAKMISGPTKKNNKVRKLAPKPPIQNAAAVSPSLFDKEFDCASRFRCECDKVLNRPDCHATYDAL
jgi:hypothetical protein